MSLSRRTMRTIATCVAVSTCSWGLAACGSSSSTAGGSAPTAAAASPAADVSGAPAAAGKVPLPKITIGVIPITAAASEVLAQAVDGLQAGAKVLGWKVNVIDPNANAAKAQSAMATMISEKVSAIITMAIDAPLLGPELADAKAAGIPVIDVNNGVDPQTASEYSAVIAPSEPGWGTSLGNYMKASLSPEPVMEMVNAPYTSRAMADVAQSIAGPAGFKLTKVEITDLANIAPSYQADTREGFQSYPTTKYLIEPGDFAAGIVYPVLKQIGRTDVTILTRYDDQPTIALMRQGAKIVDITTNLYLPAMMALDQIAAYVAHKTPVHSVDSGFPFKTITTANIASYPATGYAYSLSSTLAPYQSKWSSEYAIS